MSDEKCPHCPDGHADPLSKPWGVYVHSDRDGQPTHLVVGKADGSHVAESDARWLRELIRWDVYVHSGRDGDGQPTHLVVGKSDGSHVSESDARWLWELIRSQVPEGTQAEADLKASPAPQRQWRPLRTGRA